ncbi:MAG: glycerophosphodiester phosphodiesterase [Candidatus Sigynarchaeota archaeon]
MVIIFAHRGASGYAPENTIESFDRAIEMGTKAIETDVKITLDRQLVFFHDRGVGKFPRYRPLLTMTASQLQQRVISAAVPRVIDAFQYYQHKNMLNEITWSIDVPSRLVIGRLIEIAKAFRNLETIYFCGEQAATLARWARQGAPRERLVWSIRQRPIMRLGPSGVVAACKCHGIPTINVKEGWLTTPLASAIHEAGIHLFIWDCHDEPRITRALSFDPDAIYSNYPDLAVRLLEQKKKEITRS